MKISGVFILTYGRPHKVVTYHTLRKHGYTGEVYFIVSDDDKTLPEYRQLYGDKVLVFNKAKCAQMFDEGDNFQDRRGVIYARNACFGFAKLLGWKYFVELDDDYTSFDYTTKDGSYNRTKTAIRDLDRIFEIYLDFFTSINAYSIAFAQGGDFIGGARSVIWKRPLSRKCMNSFICSVDRPFKFVGRINEDVNTYTRGAFIGMQFFTTRDVRLEQIQTQANNGGMTEIYLDSGTYIKSFYSVMYQPSSVSIKLMGVSNKRLHHSVNWNRTAPKIVPERCRKVGV